MKHISGQRMGRVLERHGWRLDRIRGSHHIYAREGSRFRISIPIHGNSLLKTGLQAHLAKLARITDKDFE